MKRFLRSKLVLTLVACVLIAAAFIIPLSNAITRTHAAATTPAYVIPHPTMGHGKVMPKKVSTATTPQIRGNGHGTIPPRAAPERSTHVPSPSNVVRINAPNLTQKTNFEGLNNTGWAPSDSNGAGGTYNYFETVNEQFEIYSRGGATQYGTSFNTWFGQSGSLFDPKTIWDKAGKRFIFLVDTGSSLLVSVAQQTNGLGNYCNYSFSTLSGYFADYPQLGVNSSGIYFTANLYGNPFTSELFYAPRTAMESCQSISYSFYSNLNNADGSGASFAVVPAVERSNPGVEYLVNTNNPSGGCSVTVWTLTSGGSLSNANVNTQCFSPPPPAKQLGSSGTLETLDNRLYQATYQSGLLNFDTVGSHDWGDGNGPVGIVEWFQVNPSTASVSKQGAFGITGYWNFFPAMDVTSVGKMFFVFDSSGPTIYPSIWAISGCLCDTASLINGVSYYGTSGTARWGDFQSAWQDPVSTKSVWITGQYANGTNTWGTRVGRFIPS